MGFLDLFFPKNCLECGKQNQYICDDCLQKVEILNTFNPKIQTFSLFKFNGVVRKAIIKIKYNFSSDITKELSEVFINHFKNPFGKNVILIPIPLHKSRLNWRGFNQSEILGKLISEKLGWQFESSCLIKISGGKTQVGLNLSDRARNIRGKFAVIPGYKFSQNKTYIIFDDVATTGATIKEAIKVLKNSGAKKVFGLTIAR